MVKDLIIALWFVYWLTTATLAVLLGATEEWAIRGGMMACIMLTLVWLVFRVRDYSRLERIKKEIDWV